MFLPNSKFKRPVDPWISRGPGVARYKHELDFGEEDCGLWWRLRIGERRRAQKLVVSEWNNLHLQNKSAEITGKGTCIEMSRTYLGMCSVVMTAWLKSSMLLFLASPRYAMNSFSMICWRKVVWHSRYARRMSWSRSVQVKVVEINASSFSLII